MARSHDTKLYDLLAAAPLILWYALAIWQLAPGLAAEAAALWPAYRPGALLDLTARAATLVFLGLQIVLFLIRRVPQAKAPGIGPRLAALIGSNIQLAFLALPHAQMSLAATALSAVLVTLGTVAAIVVAVWLGRSFSVFPQARRLVVRGPYRAVRHPLYLAEQIATWGVVLQYAQPWSVLIGAASFAAQFPRMHYEEQILGEAYPGYADYAARTWRLIPYVY
jgi:protein-S-isoprenylcysteine O-methyltransferase Ste14